MTKLGLALTFALYSAASKLGFSRILSQTDDRYEYQQDHLEQQSRRRDEGCPVAYPETIAINLTRDFMKNKVNEVMELADMVNREEYGDIEDLIQDQRIVYEQFDGFSDYNDQALVAKTKDTQICFATFQSTDPGNGIIAFLFDHWQNLNPFTSRIGETDCIVRNGIIDVYNATYKDEFRQSLDACVASCDDGDCPLVLGGFSQGGAAAIAASIDLSHYNPEVITFAALRTIVDTEPCTQIDESRHYRFVNTRSDGYDVIPMQFNLYRERHVGRLLLLDDVNFPLLSPQMSDSQSRQPRKLDLHDYPTYRGRIEGMINRNCFPIPVARWPEGHYCRYDDECETSYCEDKACRRR